MMMTMMMRTGLAAGALAVGLVWAAAARGETNLVSNGEFSRGLAPWRGGNYSGGAGSVGVATEGGGEDERAFARLVKTRGPGGAQLLQQAALPAGVAKLRFSFRAKGCPSNVYVKFRAADGKTAFTDSLGRPAQAKVVFYGAADWKTVERVLAVPAAAQETGGAVIVHFGILAGASENVLLVDDVVLAPVADEAKGPPRPLTFAFAPTPAPDASYRPVEPVAGADFTVEARDGLLWRNGTPHFWVGNGVDLGSGHGTPAGLWLAKLQGQEFVCPTDGIDWTGRLDGDVLTLGATRVPAANLAWIREAQRLGLLPNVTVTSRYFKYSHLKKIAERHPDFGDFHYDVGHFMSVDTGHPAGRRWMAEKRKGLLTQVGNDRKLVLEFAREPGPEPGNRRTRAAYAAWARRKYGDLATANAVWRTAYADWAEVAPPHLPADVLRSGGHVQKLELRAWALKNRPEMYFDWLAFVLEDNAACLAGEVADVKAFAPDVLTTFDVRGHHSDNDDYMTVPFAAVDRLFDIFGLHDGYSAYFYDGAPYDLSSLRVATAFPLFKYSFFRANTTKPLWNAEDIVASVRSANASESAMAKNDLGRLMDADWEFRKDGDAAWDRIPVPAAWDAQEKWKGYAGTAWYRRPFTVERRYADDYADGSRKFYFVGKGIAQRGTVWVNGHEVGNVKGWATPFKFDVGRYLKFGERNELLIRAEGNGGFLNGLRGYYHILPQDMVSESRPFGEKQYTAMLWTYFAQGSSAVSVWNWGADTYRPYFPALIDRINACAARVSGALREPRRGKVAMLYPYLYARGLPFAPFVARDAVRLDWFNALVFDGCEPDVLSEESLAARLDPAAYPVLFAPQCDLVEDRTWAAVKAYLAKGGRVVMTDGSFAKTFGRYAATDVAAQPNVTRLSEKLEMEALMAAFRPFLPADDLPLEVAADGEPPLLHKVFARQGDFAFLYLHNWGGKDKRVSFRLPAAVAGWKVVPMEGDFRADAGRVSVVVPSQAPAVALLARDAGFSYETPASVKAREAELRRLQSLDAGAEARAGRPKALFFKSARQGDMRVGAEVYPELCAAIRAAGCDVESVPSKEWTPEKLAAYRLVILPETATAHIRPTLEDKAAMSNLVEWVRAGGRLFCPVYSANTLNAQGRLVRRGQLSPLGVAGFGDSAWRGSGFAYGDVHQVVTENVDGSSPLGAGVKSVSLYCDQALRLTKGSPLRPVVSFPADAEGKGAGGPVVVAGEVGKGRVVVSSDVMLFQPYRIDKADNARLLKNIVDYLTSAAD